MAEERIAGRYLVERALAYGATARLVSALDEREGRAVALKLLEEHFAAHGLVRARFLREMEAVASLRGEHVHRVLDLGLDERGWPFAVLEPLEGTNLEELRRARGGRLTPEELRPIARAAATGLLEAHREGIVHRDVRPAHLWLGADGAWKVGDFGMASVDGAVGLTSHSLVLGSPAYLAPEIFGSGAVDGRADVYGLGVTLHECLAGAMPWPTSQSGELLRRKLSEPPPGLPEAIAKQDPELGRIVLRAMARRPAERWASMEELLRALEPSMALARWGAEPPRSRLCPSCGAEREAGIALCLECGALDEEAVEVEKPTALVIEELRGGDAELGELARTLASISDVDAERMRERLERARHRLPSLVAGSLRPRAASALKKRLTPLGCRVAAYREGPALDALMTGGRGLLLTTAFVLGAVVLPMGLAWMSDPVMGVVASLLALLLFSTRQREVYRLLGKTLRPLLGRVRKDPAPALPDAVARAYREVVQRVKGPETREAARQALRLGSRLFGLLDGGAGPGGKDGAALREDLSQILTQACAIAARVETLDEQLGAFHPRRSFDRLERVDRGLLETSSSLEAEALMLEKRQLEALFERGAADERLRAAAMGKLLELVGKLEELGARLAAHRLASEPELLTALRDFSSDLTARLAAVDELKNKKTSRNAQKSGSRDAHPWPEVQEDGVLLPAGGPALLPAKAPGLQASDLVGRSAPLASRYQLVREIGRGGIAVVYLAEDRLLGRAVAIKLVASSGRSLGLHRDRLRQELDSASRLENPHVVRVHELIEEEDRLALVLEYVPGLDFKRWISQAGGRLSAEETLRVARDALRALGAAHALGIVHGDVKPHNLLRTPDGGAKLTDFGMARLESELGAATDSLVIGTPEYAAPEALSGEALDHRADLYGLGVTLYELCTGSLPYDGRGPFELLHAQAEASARPPREIATGIPEFLERAILTAMAKEPEERFQSAEEMLAALEPRHSHSLLPASASSARPQAGSLCLLCQAENPTGSPVCWSCGAAPSSIPEGAAMLVLLPKESDSVDRTLEALSLLDSTCRLEEQPPDVWLIAGSRYETILAREFLASLRAKGYEARAELSPVLAWTGLLSTPAEKDRAGRVALALSAFWATLWWGVFGSVWVHLFWSLAAGLVAYLSLPRSVTKRVGLLLEPLIAPRRRPALLDWPVQIRNLPFLGGLAPGWYSVAVAPPPGGWTLDNLSSLLRETANKAPCGALRGLVEDKPKILARDLEAAAAQRISSALREKGVDTEVRRIWGRNEDMVTNWVLSVPAGLPGVGLGILAAWAASFFLSRQLTLLFGAILPFYVAYFSRRLILRAAGLIAGSLRQPFLTPRRDLPASTNLPVKISQRYSSLLDQSKGTRIQRQLQRLMRRALRLLPRLEELEAAWFGGSNGRVALEELMARSLELAERALRLERFQSEHPEMELMERVLELEKAPDAPALERARNALRQHAEVGRERRRLGSLLSRVAGALTSLEERLTEVQPIDEPDEPLLLSRALAELEAELQKPIRD